MLANINDMAGPSARKCTGQFSLVRPIGRAFSFGEVMDYPKLAEELATDPLTRNYVGMDDSQAADSLNAQDRQRDRSVMTGREVKANVDSEEYAGLVAEKKTEFLALVARDDLDPQGVDADIVQDIFGAGPTLTALQAARTETVSRAVERGIGFVTAQDVVIARAL